MRKGYSESIWRQLLNDAPYAWYLRDFASTSATHRLSDLKQLDAQLNDYLNAISVGVSAGLSPLEQININDRGAVFVMASLGIRENNNKYVALATKTVKENSDRAKELYQALGAYQLESTLLSRIIDSQDPYVRQASIACLKQTTSKKSLTRLLADTSPIVLSTLLSAIGRVRNKDCYDVVLSHYMHEDINVRFNAVKAGVYLGDIDASQRLSEFITPGSPYIRESVELLCRLGDQENICSLIDSCMSQNISDRVKALSLGYSGNIQHIPRLISMMNATHTAQVIGESFSLLTGLDLSECQLDEETPGGDEPSAADKQEVDSEYRDYEELLPWPSVDKISEWWKKSKVNFSNESRYLCGLKIEEINLDRLLIDGTQTQRHAASLELARLNPRDSLYDIKKMDF